MQLLQFSVMKACVCVCGGGGGGGGGGSCSPLLHHYLTRDMFVTQIWLSELIAS